MLNDLQIRPSDPGREARVQTAIDSKTKPPGSLGRVEELAVQIALAQHSDAPSINAPHLIIFAGDHGMATAGVSAWPQDVTAQMVLNFLSGGAASNVFARSNDCSLTVADAGVVGPLPDDADLARAGIRAGTRNAIEEDAMTSTELDAALRFGAAQANQAIASGSNTIALGEMGIGNTASAALLAHKVLGLDLRALTGPGAGLDDAGVDRKYQLLSRAAARYPDRMSGMEALAAYGGLEIAAMAGAMIQTASQGCVAVVDGFISSAASVVALSARPDVRPHLVFAHQSAEPGHVLVMEAIDAKPLIHLDMRLGEGTGALLAIPLLRAACAMLAEMATFESAGVSGKSE